MPGGKLSGGRGRRSEGKFAREKCQGTANVLIPSVYERFFPIMIVKGK